MPESFAKRHLPHWYVPGAAHFVTCRLTGTLPAEALDELRRTKEAWLRESPRAAESRTAQRYRIHKQLFDKYDDFLDQPSKIRWLGEPRVAAKVRGSLYYLHERKAHLMAYCIMPNHLHVLWQPLEPAGTSGDGGIVRSAGQAGRLSYEVGESADGSGALSSLMHSLKSYTAHEANRLLRRSSQFWQHESYDHWVRDDDELERIVEYIRHNPVKAGLVSKAQDWYWCSAHDRFLHDAAESGWLPWPSVG